MKQAAKQMERQKKIDEKRRKREEEQQRKEDEKKRKAEIKKNRQSKKRTSSVKKKKAIVEEVRNIYFSSNLESIVTTESPVPDFVVKCAELVKKDGMDTVGIYRLSGKHDDVKIIHDKYEQGELDHTHHPVCSRWSLCSEDMVGPGCGPSVVRTW